MTQRHPIINDAIMLVTTVTRHRSPIFENSVHAREAVECLYRVKKMHPFFLYGFVIMPDHCHFLVDVPLPETAARIMNIYKSGMTFNIGIPKLWQSRYHLRIVRDPISCLRYVHENPVKQNMVETCEDYPWSSASGR